MNFKIVDGKYNDLDKIKEDFTQDYLHTSIPNPVIKKKYGLTIGEWYELTNMVKKEHGLTCRPRLGAKYYIKSKNKYVITKSLNGKPYHIGSVPSEKVAKLVVEECKKAEWDIMKCKQIVNNWEDYV